MKKLLLLFICVILFQFSFGQNLTGKILFSRHSYNNSTTPDSIFALNNDGKTLTFVTLGNRPRISHSGKLMEFCNGPVPNESYNASLWMRDLVRQKDTSIIPTGGNDYLDYYDFSSTDTRVVYSYDCGIYSANANGSNINQLLNRNCYTDYPTVRPSDSLVTYHDVLEGLSTVNFNGANDARVPHTYPGDVYPVWSPDGQWIAYERSNPGYTPSILLCNILKIKPDGQDSTPLSFFPATDTICPDVVWAKDMQTLFFIGKINDTTGIYQLHTDGSGNYKRIFNFNDNSVFAYIGTQGYYLTHFWLGLADSIFSNQVVVNYCDSVRGVGFDYGGNVNDIAFSNGTTAPAALNLTYKWNFDDSASGANDSSSLRFPSHTFSTPGVYNVCLTVKAIGAGDTCTSSICTNVTVVPSGVVNINGPNVFKLSPNPGDGNIQITLPGNLSGVSQYSITNILGEKVYNGIITSLETKLSLNIPEGTYFVSVFNSEKQFTERLVIQK